MFLLQAGFGTFPLFTETNPMEGVIILSIIGGLIVTSLIVGFIRRGVVSRSIEPGRPTGSAFGGRRVGFFAMRRISSAYGLDREQSKLLASIFRIESVTDPDRFMENPLLLDRLFKKAYRTIEKNSRSAEDAQWHLAKLFSLRNAIEASPSPDSGSGNRLAPNTSAILAIGKDSYPVKIISSEGHTVTTDVPKSVLGTPIRLTKGTGVSLSFFTKSSKGFSLDGRIAGSGFSNKGHTLQIVHTGKAKALVKRNFRRRQISISCELFTVTVEVTGSERKRTSRLVVGKKAMSGTVLDISAGGCSLKTSSQITAGSRLKICIDTEVNFINVLGEVLRSNRSAGMGVILHIKFLKVPRQAFNSISALVFGFDEISF
jgi:hypothetical protein